MNIKWQQMHRYHQLNLKKQIKQTRRTGTESCIWRSFGELSVGRGEKENIGEGAGIKKHRLVGTKQGDVKNSICNEVAKELICMTHGYELRGRIAGGNGGTGYKVTEGKIRTTVIA